MKGELEYGVIHAIKIEPGIFAAQVKFPNGEDGGLISDWLPVLQGASQAVKKQLMPDVGSQVACLMDEYCEDGVVLGCVYSDIDTTATQSADKDHASYPDGCKIEYDYVANILTVDTPGDVKIIAAKSVKIETNACEIQCNTAKITASQTITANCATANITAQTAINATSPMTTFTGAVTINGLLTMAGGFAAMPTAGGAPCTISTTVKITSGDLIVGNIPFLNHKHPHGDAAGISSTPIA